MSTLSKETMETVDGLIAACKDGQAGFRAAAAIHPRPPLHRVFRDLSVQRGNFARELQRTVMALGQREPTNQSTVAGDLHRAWITLRGAVAGTDEETIVAECERGEEHARKVYRQALERCDLPPELSEVLTRQLHEIEAAGALMRPG